MARLPKELEHCDPRKLPNTAGVLVVLCSKRGIGDSLSIIDKMICEDIKKTAEASAVGWASHCDSGHLTYRVFLSDDPKERQIVLAQIQ